MKGYIGKSMSVRAYRAYDEGKMPISNWRKSDILDRAEDAFGDEFAAQLKKFKLADLKKVCLKKTEWHHTGKYFAETNFYDFVEDAEPQEIIAELSALNQDSTQEEVKEKWSVRFVDEWLIKGKRRTPIWKETTGTIEGNWFFEDGTGKRKSVAGNWFVKLEKLN